MRDLTKTTEYILGKTTYVLSVQSEQRGTYQRDHYEIRNPTQGDRTFYYINRTNEFSTLEQLVKHFSGKLMLKISISILIDVTCLSWYSLRSVHILTVENPDGLQTKLKYPSIENHYEYLKPVDEVTEPRSVAPNRVPDHPVVYVQPQPQQTQATPDRPPKNKTQKQKEKPPVLQGSQNVLETEKANAFDVNKYNISEDRINQQEKIGGGEFAEVFEGIPYLFVTPNMDAGLSWR